MKPDFDFVNENLKWQIAKFPERFNSVSIFSVFDEDEHETAKGALTGLINRGVVSVNDNGLLSFNFCKPYRIDTGTGLIGYTQAKLAAKGIVWNEQIFNDGKGVNVMINITRDPDCNWNHVYSNSFLSRGWGRFDRSQAWVTINSWLDEGGFEKSNS